MSANPKFTSKTSFTPKNIEAGSPPVKTDEQLLVEISEAKDAIDAQNKKKKAAETELLQRREKEIQQLLKAKDEPYGTVTIVVGNHQVKVDVKKSVKWDNEKLSAIAAQMLAEKVNPTNYMKIEYSISETLYKTWDDEMKKEFLPARTVTPGKATIKLSEEE